MTEPRPTTSRRALLRALTAAPVAAISTNAMASPWSAALATLNERYCDPPATLRRTQKGRSLSRFRYHNAEGFFLPLESGILRPGHDFFYTIGIVAQLALSAHLLDVGFSDQWCAHHIGLRVAHSLTYANATGLGHDCPQMARLANILTPYWKWNHPRYGEEPVPDDGGFSTSDAVQLLRALLDRVHEVTGHSRPQGWRRRLAPKEACT